jgi:hypothetical protein
MTWLPHAVNNLVLDAKTRHLNLASFHLYNCQHRGVLPLDLERLQIRKLLHVKHLSEKHNMCTARCEHHASCRAEFQHSTQDEQQW